MKYKIIIWGIGAIYNKRVNILKYLEFRDEIEIVAITGKGYSFLNKIDGYQVIDKSKIIEYSFDYIIIMSGKELEIIDEALELGISRENILPYKILDLPCFNFDDYIRLKNSKITIISDNCWGGIVYHTLGLECLSPFKNLCLVEGEYIKLLKRLRYYLEYPLEFSRFVTSSHSKERYPVMHLKDVEVLCNHYENPHIAQECWNRRVGKINWDNLFIAMHTENKKIAEEFLDLDFEKKVCFVPFETKTENLIYLHKTENQKYFFETVNTNGHIENGGYAYQLVTLLLGEESFART